MKSIKTSTGKALADLEVIDCSFVEGFFPFFENRLTQSFCLIFL